MCSDVNYGKWSNVNVMHLARSQAGVTTLSKERVVIIQRDQGHLGKPPKIYISRKGTKKNTKYPQGYCCKKQSFLVYIISVRSSLFNAVNYKKDIKVLKTVLHALILCSVSIPFHSLHFSARIVTPFYTWIGWYQVSLWLSSCQAFWYVWMNEAAYRTHTP